MAKTIGIIVNGATSGISNRQHLPQALVPIIREGGLDIGGERFVPDLLLLGRNEAKLRRVAAQYGLDKIATDLDAALADPAYPIFFDSGVTGHRPTVLRKALEAGKDIYTEKPVVTALEDGKALIALATALGRKHGAVEDKLFLPGLVKLRQTAESGVLGRITTFRLDFGYWIFSGHGAIPMQRPSWNYRAEDGGGLMMDMFPHWRYVIEGILGPIRRVVARGWTALPERVDETGKPFAVDTDDSTAAIVELESGAVGVVTSSWATRVHREDLLTFHVDGIGGSAVAGLHRCALQPAAVTPKTRFDPNTDLGVDYREGWVDVPETLPFANGYRKGWEAFLRHVVAGAPKAADLSDGLRDVALGRAVSISSAEGRWVDMKELV
ncbi:Gfo/Idh/MocA family protein [Acuticoccus mangrovi]|uniref:Gfo/Idh/MocA family oxidoreductase n=1 Tax=Acuticoccus mangrovi TaxID=2796142 RepID=A0A934MJJ5_9HYPH|nr:Gfo/Idh/MocA family oxidoreductase [Acuticoccus mangrovi]MBJ3774614.1 Gfo/Idh/MocA family oxidoreductase [Acuticoccus mangrovi]